MNRHMCISVSIAQLFGQRMRRNCLNFAFLDVQGPDKGFRKKASVSMLLSLGTIVNALDFMQ